MPLKPKKSMSSFDVAAVAAEASRLLVGSRLANIYDAPGGFLLRFKGGRGEYRVVAVPGERVHLTRLDIAGKGMPSPLVMGIRKHVREAVVEEVGQHGFDRILSFKLRRGGGEYFLHVEVLPRGVLVLTDSQGVILQASEYREMRDRVIRRGVKYEPPPGRVVHPVSLSAEKVVEALRSGKGAARALSRGLGYPGEVVEEALARLGIGVEDSEGAAARAVEVAEELRRIYQESLGPGGFILYGDEGLPVTVVPFEPRGLVERYGYTVKRFGSFSEALDVYFGEEMVKLREAEAVSEAEAEKARLRASLERALENLKSLEEKARRLEEEIRVIGENIALLYEVHECVERVRKSAGWEAVPGSCPSVVDVRPQEGVVVVNLSGRLVEIPVRLTPDRFLVELDKRMGELRAKIERGRRAVAELEARIAEVEKELAQRAARARAAVRRREWYERYHWLVTRSGYLAIGGRDASQNESVVKRYLSEKRIFMHADVHGAPAVVVFNEGEEPPEEDLRDAAVLTAAYSKAWKGGVGAVDVYWVWGSQVSKSPPPGEYLARGAFMVYGRRNYIRGVELRIAVGVGIEDESVVVIVGPPDLVERRSAAYAILVPGDEDPSRLAARLRRLLAAKAPEELRGYLEAVTPEELRMRIPGRSRVVRVARGRMSEPPRPIKKLPGAPEG